MFSHADLAEGTLFAAEFRVVRRLASGGMGAVYLAERRTLDLERAEVEFLIHRVGAVGDHYDDELIARFGGSRITDPS